MDLLTVPRTVAGFEYKVLRYPSQLIATKVVAVRLPAESGLRLAYERLLGALDTRVGALLADPELTDRGRALSRRVEVVEKAVTLEAKAAQRREQANADLRSQMSRAAQDKNQAKADQQDEQRRIEAERKAEKQAVESTVADRARRQAAEVDAQAAADAEQERQRLSAQTTRIEQTTDLRTAGAKAALSDAAQDKREARERKAEADTLAGLAKAEKASRRS